MKYIIMCGGLKDDLVKNNIIPHLCKINGESIVERTIRILRELGIEDISISTGTNISAFDFLNVPILKFDNNYHLVKTGLGTGYWVEAFYYTSEPCCYICGDTWFSKAALKKIVDTKCKDFLMFGTQKPFAKGYNKRWEEPLAFKVVDQDLLHKYCEIFKEYEDNKKFNRKGMSWELYRLIEGYDPNKHIMGERFIGIHDFACDIDKSSEVEELEEIIEKYNIN